MGSVRTVESASTAYCGETTSCRVYTWMPVYRSAGKKYTPEGEASFSERWYVSGNPTRCNTSGHGRNGCGAWEEAHTVYEDQDRAIPKDPGEIGEFGEGSM
jgi:hypothetical protein